MRLLFKVKGVLELSGIGCVVSPEIPPEMASDIRVKDRIQLRTPEGRQIDTHISLFFTRRPKGEGRFVAIVLPRDVSKSHVPIDTEVWHL